MSPCRLTARRMAKWKNECSETYELMIPGGLAAGRPILASEPGLAGPLHPLAERLHEAVGQHRAGGRRVERLPAGTRRKLCEETRFSLTCVFAFHLYSTHGSQSNQAFLKRLSIKS